MRASTLGNNVLAINREIDSRYDAVIAVRDHLPEIELVAGMDFNALITQMLEAQDFTGITVIEGPNVSWDPVNKVLVVPRGKDGIDGKDGVDGRDGIDGKDGKRGVKGDKGDRGSPGKNGKNGINGLNGMAPIYRFSIDNKHNLVYEVIGYEEGPTSGERFPVQEW